ncbi:MAG: nicotinate-nicotinamide nucleotide adenylyltransferase [Deltaproteobacteria bacterium]|nr:nicotinate-nicotinamide nucleotide adenylyltransferase [Deltaproteobacteria bacterium]
MSPSSMLDNPGAGEPKTPSFELFVPAQTVLPPSNARLGVLGGAYNPITRAHLLLARCSKEQFKLHEIMFVLPKTLPNKPVVDTSVEQRLEMMRLGTTDVPYISLGLCTHGMFLDICAALQKVYLQSPEIFFITGRDAAERILNWPYPEPAEALARMFAGFQLLVFEREGKLKVRENPLIRQYSNRIHTLRLSENIDHISSTEVRQRILTGQSIEELVPTAVATYIMNHNLYQNQSDQH